MKPDEAKRREAELFAQAQGLTPEGPVFILGAPRTGSTFLYQALCAAFELPFISNETNRDFAETPIVGLERQQRQQPWGHLSERSRFGKVDGDLQPSEGSAVMMRWFGGGHPSEIVSAAFLDGALDHMAGTIRAAHALAGAPLVIKNAWNCFRIPAISAGLPNAAFVWIRRDLIAAAQSDLAARYKVQGDPAIWNSATPRNVDDLRRRPHWEQVVENQVAFNRAIREARSRLPAGRFTELWYEDLRADLQGALAHLSDALDALRGRSPRRLLTVLDSETAPALPGDDARRLRDYVEANRARFQHERYPGEIEEETAHA